MMAGVQIVLGQFGVGLDHFHGAVTRQGLRDVAVAAVAQEMHGEGVAEATGIGVGDAGATAVAPNEPAQGTAAYGDSSCGEERTLGVAARLGTLSEMAPEGLCGGGLLRATMAVLRAELARLQQKKYKQSLVIHHVRSPNPLPRVRSYASR